jgi:regulator of sigma E protease
MNLISTLAAFIVTLGSLIVVHELGHYWAARRCGVKVLRFSIGFGRPLWRAVRGPDRTEWVLAAIPLGGYVRMLDERDDDGERIAAADLPRAFNRQTVWRRIFIVLAGPMANLLLAIVVYWVLAMAGTIEPKPVLASPAPDSIAARAGVGGGDTVIGFGDTEVRSWNELRWQVLQAVVARGEFELKVVDARGNERNLSLAIRAEDVPEVEGDVVDRLGFALYAPARVNRVTPDGPAARAGLRDGDEIVAVDGAATRNMREVQQRVMPRPDATLGVELLRDGRRQVVQIAAASAEVNGQRVGRIGVEFAPPATVTVRDGPIDGLIRATVRTWDTTLFSFRMLGRMLIGEVSWKNLSGPVTIADYAGQTARIGIVSFLSFLALVSISIGVLNLLPIPMLDGGHLLYYAVEIVRGSPPAQWLVEWGQRAGIAVLVMLTALALYNDLARLLT